MMAAKLDRIPVIPFPIKLLNFLRKIVTNQKGFHLAH